MSTVYVNSVNTQVAGWHCLPSALLLLGSALRPPRVQTQGRPVPQNKQACYPVVPLGVARGTPEQFSPLVTLPRAYVAAAAAVAANCLFREWCLRFLT